LILAGSGIIRPRTARLLTANLVGVHVSQASPHQRLFFLVQREDAIEPDIFVEKAMTLLISAGIVRLGFRRW
jgi:uncharacterized membrane protein